MVSVLVVSTGDVICLVVSWGFKLIRFGLACTCPSLCLCMKQTPYDILPRRNISSGTCCHTLVRLELASSARLYYTAPYQFLVSMFRAPVLVLPADTVRRTSLHRYVLR